MQNVENTKQEQKPKSFKGFPLFNEIEDRQLRRRNQAVIMTNILEDSFVEGKCTVKGASLITGYMSHIPEEERRELFDEFVSQASVRGFKTK